MAIKKSELYSSIWASCDALRGGMDASQYKDYVLVLLFVKYVSDKYSGQKNPLIVIPNGGSFADMVALKGDKDIGNKINIIIAALAKENGLKGVIDLTDFNDPDKLGKGKEMVDRLSKLVAIFENPALDFTKNRAEGDDLLGDAYEYLMRNFATQSGKSKGQFYTPAEVSRIMAKVIGVSEAKSAETTIYDPTCGSGSLLLKAADEARVKISIYGQEMDNSTAGLARMNMILHDNPSAEIWKDNTLSEPHYKEKSGQLKQFDFAVANPPFSTKAWSSGFDPEHDQYGRFEDGMPPQKNGDYAFLQHLLRSLKSSGKGAIILPHGVLFRGGAEAQIRRNLICKGYIKGIIGLPANLFFGTGIPACIIVLDKETAGGRKDIFMVNASQGFMKDGNKNRLRHQDIHKIVDVFNRKIEILKYSRMVPLAEISDPKNDYNLNIPRYIDNSEEEDLQDIAAHLLGGIPNRDIENLSAYWKVFPSLREQLFAANGRAGYSEAKADAAHVKQTIFAHLEFTAFNQTITVLFEKWMKKEKPLLAGLQAGSHPKEVISALGEDLLNTFADAPLLDKYDVYQSLMTYWSETMQDDVYMIATEGWAANSDLIPAQLIVQRYFAAEQQEIETRSAEQENLLAKIEELNEEHGSEEGLLAEVMNDKGKVSKGSILSRLRKLTQEDGEPTPDDKDEFELLHWYGYLIDKAAEASKQVKEAQKKLDERVAAKYNQLSIDEIKAIVIDDKWFVTIAGQINALTQAVASQFANRIKELAERYALPLPQLNHDVDTLTNKVDTHLEKMGFAWK
jgi:type I restriction enzyme M protein